MIYTHKLPKLACIYVLVCLVNNKWYIGKAVNLNRRMRQHKSANETLIDRAIKVHGWHNFKLKILHWWKEIPQDKYEMFALETACIDEYKTLTKDGGYNICLLGEGTTGHKHSEESKRKMSLNCSRPNLGKIFSQERRKKMSDAAYNRPIVSEETKRKISIAHLGKKFSKETKKKMSDSHSGEKHWNYGKITPLETIQKRLQKMPSYVGKNNPAFDHCIYTFINKLTNEIFRGTRYDFYTKYNLSSKQLTHVVAGKRKYCGDWILQSFNELVP